MRAIARSMVVVCLLLFSLGVVASPREREPRGGVIGKIVKKIKALGDGLTIPVPAQKP